MTTRGRPTLTEMRFMSDCIRIPLAVTNASAWRRTLISGDTRLQYRGALSNTLSTLVFSS
jgi:hypothetical protein